MKGFVIIVPNTDVHIKNQMYDTHSNEPISIFDLLALKEIQKFVNSFYCLAYVVILLDNIITLSNSIKQIRSTSTCSIIIYIRVYQFLV